jgi:hypothetical protein
MGAIVSGLCFAAEPNMTTRRHRAPTSALILLATAPLAWFGCGGSTPPPETPADQASTSPDSGESTATSDNAAASAAPEPSSAPAEAPPAKTADTAPAAPPTPSLGSTDCGKCIDKTCSKQEAACGKNTDCQSMIDGIHSCSSGAKACLDGATAPTAAKPKKLAAAYQTCAKKATTAACKAKCQ